jgi:hypothetical protein
VSAGATVAIRHRYPLALGALWWLLVLRHRLNAGTAGPPDAARRSR